MYNTTRVLGLSCDIFRHTANSYCNIGRVLENQRKHDEALMELRKGLAIQESKLGKDHPDTATTYNNIGQALYRQGKHDEALVEHRKCVAIQESKLGKDHPDTANSRAWVQHLENL